MPSHAQHHFVSLGEDRVKLANYVTEQLNVKHQNDAAVLDKFRREAEEFRRNKLRRNVISHHKV